MTDFKRNRHALYKLHYHLVVVTKYRQRCITNEMMQRLKEITSNLFKAWNCELMEMNGEADYIHIRFNTPPQVQLSKIINSYKTVTSRYMRKEYAEHLQSFYSKPYFWSQSYMILSSGEATTDVMEKYIEEQGLEKG
jgi:putative transposase